MKPRMPNVQCERVHPCLPVRDVGAAVAFYTAKLGFAVGFTWPEEGTPTMAGVNLGEVQVFLEQGTPNPSGVSVSFVVGDADELCDAQRAAGVQVLIEPADRPYGLRDYRVRDLDGYHLSFGHYLYNVGDPIEIERVDVRVRLEKRLAALLEDLATHKRMSLTSCLEEILLHTSEELGETGGVPSPHTRPQLRHIRDLKKKHGIDYDSHASYRFIEK